ncbi:MAG: hypothetical protein U0842_06550 [Candidatus Binatia bacterium]
MTNVHHNRLAALVVAAAVLLGIAASPSRAFAVQLDYTCRDAANILSFGQESLQFSLVGETVGAAGLLANLACFVGDRRCSCLRNTTNSDRGESNQFSREVGRIIAGCFTSNPSRNLSGISQEAALNICG